MLLRRAAGIKPALTGGGGMMIVTANTRTRLTRGISATAMAAALAIAQPAAAQSDISTLQGHVDGATAGAQVVATDRNTGQRFTAQVDAGGNYRILGVRPSTYSVVVNGYSAVETTVLVGETATVDFAAQTGDIVVTGNRSIREVRTQSVSTSITPAQIENLPQNQRNFLSFAALAPGVSVTRGGNAQVQAGATASSNVNVLLDGMSLKNSINHGGIFGQNFGLGNPFPQSAIQEYRVETQNFGAETGQVGSALITAITKTGGDKFHGSAFIEFQPRSFIEQPYFDKRAGVVKPKYDRKQFGGEIGGPIIPGKLSFYFAGEGTTESLPGATGFTKDVPASVSSLVNTSHSFNFKQGLYFGKLTWFADEADTVNLEAFIRRENNLSDIDTNAAPTHGRTILTHEDRYQFNWRHSDGDLLNFLNLLYDKSTQSTPSVGSGPEYVIDNSYDPSLSPTCPADDASCSFGQADFSGRALLGAHFYFQGDTQKTYTIKDDLTLAKGEHTIKAGLQISLLDLSRTVSDHFNGSYYYFNPGPGGTFDPATSIPYGAQINIEPTPKLQAQDTQFGFYAQDEWKPDDHWTFNLGLRYDLETNANNNDYVTPTTIATALRNYAGWKAAGINPADYISTGHNRKPEYGAIQPRLGFAYDVHGDRDLVIFGGAGRYFDRSLFIEGVIEQLTNSNHIVNYNFNGACAAADAPAYCRDPGALRTLLAGQNYSGGSVFVLNNKTRLPFSDQFDIGIRKKFGSIQTSLTFSHVRSHNIFQFTRANYYENGWYTRRVTRTPIIKDDNGNYVSGGVVTGCSDGGNAWIQDNIPGSLTNTDGTAVPTSICAAQNGQLPGFSGKLDIGRSDGKATYNAIYLSIDKPFTNLSTWGFTTALTLQLARTNDAQELNGDEFYNGTSQNVYDEDFVNGVEKWRLVTTGNYRAPFGIELSGTLNLSSGPSFGHFDFSNPPDGACCYANMGGVYYPKKFIGYKRLDLRIAKSFKMPFNREHELTVDFQAFNVFNWLNRNYSSWGSGSGSPPPFTEDSQIGQDARSFQAGVKYRF